jgi:hypothetical protein
MILFRKLVNLHMYFAFDLISILQAVKTLSDAAKAYSMLRDDDCIAFGSRAALDVFLSRDLGVYCAEDLRALDKEFVDELRLRILPTKRKLFYSLFEV